jgi:hypothetical protein
VVAGHRSRGAVGERRWEVTDHDHIEHRIGKHRVWMTAKQAELWNSCNPFRREDFIGALIHLGGYELPFAAALGSFTLMCEIEDAPAVPLTSAPPAKGT